jgi:hypothetical protein
VALHRFLFDWVGSGGLNGAIRITTGPVEGNLDWLRKWSLICIE